MLPSKKKIVLPAAENPIEGSPRGGRVISTASGKFWLVHRIGGSSSIGHLTKESAYAEAQRLAEKHSGEIFYVLETIGMKTNFKPRSGRITA